MAHGHALVAHRVALGRSLLHDSKLSNFGIPSLVNLASKIRCDLLLQREAAHLQPRGRIVFEQLALLLRWCTLRLLLELRHLLEVVVVIHDLSRCLLIQMRSVAAHRSILGALGDTTSGVRSLLSLSQGPGCFDTSAGQVFSSALGH